jgi:excisionase family DNA binding protein
VAYGYLCVLFGTHRKRVTTGGDQVSSSNNAATEPERHITIGEAAAILGFSVKSLQRWDRSGKFPAHKTPGGRRYYLRSELPDAVKRAA